MKTIGELMKERPAHEVYSVLPDQNVLSAAQFMREKNIGAVAVMQDGMLLGVLSERDMINKVVGPGIDPRDIFVAQVMSRSITIVSPNDTWEDCLSKMRHAHCRHLPVLQNGEVIGMISLRDVLGVDEIEFLDSYLWDRTGRLAYTGECEYK